MSKISFKGQIPTGEQVKIHLSTNDGLTGYKIHKFNIMPKSPNAGDTALISKIFLTDQTGNINGEVDFNDTDMLAAAVYEDHDNKAYSVDNIIIFDIETFNQDVYITMADSDGNTRPGNYYLELEKFKLDLNSSTYHTLKSIRSDRQIGI